MSSDIRLVAVDMDGTLLNSRKELPAGFIPWVRGHSGIKTVIASGRQYYTLEHDFSSIMDHLIFIAENGALVFEKGKNVYSDVMSGKDISDCLLRLSSVPMATPILCGIRSAYLVEPDEEAKKGALSYYMRYCFTDDLRSVISTDSIVKIAVFFKDHGADGRIGYFDGLPGSLRTVISGDSWIDISNKSVNKGNAIKAIQRRYGISPEESMAFGDYLNDVEMLQSCENSYCMENGHPDLKAIAKRIAPSNDDDGVMRILDTL